MPKAKEKIKSAERHDRGKSWTSEEEDLLVDFWSREEIKEKLDGTVRAVIAHELIAKLLKDHSYERSVTSIQNKIKALRCYTISYSRQARTGVCLHICAEDCG